MLKVLLTAPARRYLKKLQRDIYRRLMRRIHRLSEEPFPSDVKRVVGLTEKVFRVRVGDYRIIYSVNYKADELAILDVDKRQRAY